MESLELAAASKEVVEELEHEIDGLEEMTQAKDRRICDLEHVHEEIVTKYERELCTFK